MSLSIYIYIFTARSMCKCHCYFVIMYQWIILSVTLKRSFSWRYQGNSLPCLQPIGTHTTAALSIRTPSPLLQAFLKAKVQIPSVGASDPVFTAQQRSERPLPDNSNARHLPEGSKDLLQVSCVVGVVCCVAYMWNVKVVKAFISA